MARSAQAFSWLLDLAQSQTVSIPAGKGPGFSSPTEAPTRLWEPLGCQAECFTSGSHVVPSDFVPQPRESLALGPGDGQKPAVLGSGANGFGHQGAAGPHG